MPLTETIELDVSGAMDTIAEVEAQLNSVEVRIDRILVSLKEALALTKQIGASRTGAIMDVKELVDGIKLLVIKPGDHIAIHVPDSIDPSEITDFALELREAWPGVKTAFFHDGVEITVIRAED